jgi:hypothetical protein
VIILTGGGTCCLGPRWRATQFLQLHVRYGVKILTCSEDRIEVVRKAINGRGRLLLPQCYHETPSVTKTENATRQTQRQEAIKPRRNERFNWTVCKLWRGVEQLRIGAIRKYAVNLGLQP